jgi:hypothetical protein
MTASTPVERVAELLAGAGYRRVATPVCTENLIRVDDVMEAPKLAE